MHTTDPNLGEVGTIIRDRWGVPVEQMDKHSFRPPAPPSRPPAQPARSIKSDPGRTVRSGRSSQGIEKVDFGSKNNNFYFDRGYFSGI